MIIRLKRDPAKPHCYEFRPSRAWARVRYWGRIDAQKQAAKAADAAWLAELPEDTRKAELAARRAARENARRPWRLSGALALEVVGSLSERYVDSVLAPFLNMERPLGVSGEPVECWLDVQKAGFLAYHATDAGPPSALRKVLGQEDDCFLIKHDSYDRGQACREGVWGSGSHRLHMAIGFTDAHRGKKFLQLARDDPGNHRQFVYCFGPEHPDYYRFEQLRIQGRLPFGSGAYFFKCRKNVLVTPGTPGFRCLEIFWRAGDPLPYIRDVTFAV